MSKEQDSRRYHTAAHAMQTGVAYQMVNDPEASATSPKHLRVGINAAMSDQAGLARLLISKGIITEEEYIKAVADAMEDERDKYQSLVPSNVTLA
jgi:hypothetical protein